MTLVHVDQLLSIMIAVLLLNYLHQYKTCHPNNLLTWNPYDQTKLVITTCFISIIIYYE